MGGGESDAVAAVNLDAQGEAAFHRVQLTQDGRPGKPVGLGLLAQQPANKSPVAADVLDFQHEAIGAGLELDGDEVVIALKSSLGPVFVN